MSRHRLVWHHACMCGVLTSSPSGHIKFATSGKPRMVQGGTRFPAASQACNDCSLDIIYNTFFKGL
eukprot:351140-Chlamydomonas_euryale.AAC.44